MGLIKKFINKLVEMITPSEEEVEKARMEYEKKRDKYLFKSKDGTWKPKIHIHTNGLFSRGYSITADPEYVDQTRREYLEKHGDDIKKIAEMSRKESERRRQRCCGCRRHSRRS